MAFGPTNDDRADWAYGACMQFSKETGQQDEPADEIISDLVCDLMHLCDREGLSFDELLVRAKGNYATEVAEEQE